MFEVLELEEQLTSSGSMTTNASLGSCLGKLEVNDPKKKNDPLKK